MKNKFLLFTISILGIFGLGLNLLSCEQSQPNTKIEINKEKKLTIKFKNNTTQKYSPLEIFMVKN